MVKPLDHEVSLNDSYFLSVSLGGYEPELDPSSLKLFFDGSEVTQKSSLSSGCGVPTTTLTSRSQPICGGGQYVIKGPLKIGSHTARVCFQDQKGQSFCYDWAFYADPGDGSGLRDLCPGDRIVPRQMGIWSPDLNQAILADEELFIDIHFPAEEIMSLDSVKLFVNDQQQTINWGPPPLRGETFFINRISPGVLSIGKHVVKIELQDKSAKTISYDWNFYIQPTE